MILYDQQLISVFYKEFILLEKKNAKVEERFFTEF